MWQPVTNKLTNSLNAETSRAVKAETIISTRLTSEITRAIKLDASLSTGLSKAISADASLSTRISSIISTNGNLSAVETLTGEIYSAINMINSTISETINNIGDVTSIPNSEWKSNITGSFSRLVLSDTGKHQTAITLSKRLSVSHDFGVSWEPKLIEIGTMWSAISISDDGQYQTAGADGVGLFVSDNYGETWEQKDVYKKWKGISMSATGDYQVAVSGEDNGDVCVYISTDFGATWNPSNSLSSPTFCKAISISSTGKNQTIIGNYNKIYVSGDFGENWEQNNAGGLLTSVGMSSDGKYQTVTTEGIGAIYVSADYGYNWKLVSSLDFTTNYSVSVSSSGKYQILFTDYQHIYISNDFGETWVKSFSLETPILSSVSISKDSLYLAATTFDSVSYTSTRNTLCSALENEIIRATNVENSIQNAIAVLPLSKKTSDPQIGSMVADLASNRILVYKGNNVWIQLNGTEVSNF